MSLKLKLNYNNPIVGPVYLYITIQSVFITLEFSPLSVRPFINFVLYIYTFFSFLISEREEMCSIQVERKKERKGKYNLRQFFLLIFRLPFLHQYIIYFIIFILKKNCENHTALHFCTWTCTWTIMVCML